MTEYELMLLENDRQRIQEARRHILGYYDGLNQYAELAHDAQDHITIVRILEDLDEKEM